MKQWAVSVLIAATIGPFLASAARAEMHIVATFGNGERTVLGLALGKVKEARLAGLILDHPWPSSNGDNDSTPARVVVVFDRETWPKFETMWSACRTDLANNDGYGFPPLLDPADGTRVSLAVVPASNWPNVLPSSEPLVRIELMDKAGNHGNVRIYRNDQRSLRELNDAIKKISDYLNQ